MADKITLARMVRLLRIAAKIDMMWLLRDTKYAIAAISADIIANLSAVSGVFLIAVRFGGIGGMSSDEVLFMMSYSTLVTGLFILLFVVVHVRTFKFGTWYTDAATGHRDLFRLVAEVYSPITPTPAGPSSTATTFTRTRAMM